MIQLSGKGALIYVGVALIAATASNAAFLHPSTVQVQVQVPVPVLTSRASFRFTPLNESSASASASASEPTSTSIPTSASTSESTASSPVIKKSKNNESNESTSKEKIAVLICPAQFCVPADYQSLITSLLTSTKNESIVCAKAVPLPRTEWIKVARQLPTKPFFDGTLNSSTTLKWYFDAMEEALAEIYAETDGDTKVCIVSHSIGGWVARAYLGGLSRSSTAVYLSTMERCTSLVTLGSPHFAPPSALVDQTRGLLKEVEGTYSCSSAGLLEERGIQATCVGSTAVGSEVFSGDVEELVALASYLPLVERWNDVVFPNKNGDEKSGVVGDGIIPKELAFMAPPAKAIEVERCSITGNPVRHAHVLPTPWNLWDGYAKSIDLPEDYVWYGSDGVIDQWIDSIQ